MERFGPDHDGDVNLAVATMAQRSAGMKTPEDLKKEDLYEWNCPAQGVWAADRFESGPGQDQCAAEGDCMCIARGAPRSSAVLDRGRETLLQKVDVERGCGGKIENAQVKVRPHYELRELPPSFDPQEINADMGAVVELPRGKWVQDFKDVAPRLQHALDELHDWINKTARSTTPLCEESALSSRRLHEAASKLRRFQILSSDCASVRDTSSKLTPPEDDWFAVSGKYLGHALNCEHANGVPQCRQLNCYRGHENEEFLARMRLLSDRISSCLQREADTSKMVAADASGSGEGTRTQELGARTPGGGAPQSRSKSFGARSAGDGVAKGSVVAMVPLSLRSEWNVVADKCVFRSSLRESSGKRFL